VCQANYPCRSPRLSPPSPDVFDTMILRYAITVALFVLGFAEQKPFWIEDESQSNIHFLGDSSDHSLDEFETADFAGITTFAHLPFINCLDPIYAEEAKETFDIAIVGAPFDTSVTYRPGYFSPQS
jgi:hypothetical protein